MCAHYLLIKRIKTRRQIFVHHHLIEMSHRYGPRFLAKQCAIWNLTNHHRNVAKSMHERLYAHILHIRYQSTQNHRSLLLPIHVKRVPTFNDRRRATMGKQCWLGWMAIALRNLRRYFLQKIHIYHMKLFQHAHNLGMSTIVEDQVVKRSIIFCILDPKPIRVQPCFFRVMHDQFDIVNLLHALRIKLRNRLVLVVQAITNIGDIQTQSLRTPHKRRIIES
mmetsp:Transcript_34300/g.55855  ORF Transcript_34300/g.55855 Transcript_34300/m.55855 type:complete len:221 (-) Transcript_34300:91-753(-)